MGLFPSAEVKVLDISTSDHFPLFLQLNKLVYAPKRRRFRFENVWIKESDCFNLIRDSWGNSNARNIMEKIDYCCLKLEEWGGGVLKEMHIKLQQCKCDLRKYRSRRDEVGIRKYN